MSRFCNFVTSLPYLGGPEEEEEKEPKPEPKQQPVQRAPKGNGEEATEQPKVHQTFFFFFFWFLQFFTLIASLQTGAGESDVFTGNMADFKDFLKQQKNVQAKAKGKKPPKGGVSKELLPELAKQARAAFRGKATDGKKEEEAQSESSSEDEDPLGLGIGTDGKKKKKKVCLRSVFFTAVSLLHMNESLSILW